MNDSGNQKTKITAEAFVDAVIGFFGWLVISNLAFLLLFLFLNLGFTGASVLIWLFAVIATVIFYNKKRRGISAGILAEFIINLVIWIPLLPSLSLGKILLVAGYPLPFRLIVTVFN